MVDKDKETVPEDAQETVKAGPKDEKQAEPKPKTKTKAKTKAKTEAKPKTKTKAETKPEAEAKTPAAEKPVESPPKAAPPPPVQPPPAVRTPPPADGGQRSLFLGGAAVVIAVVVIVVLALSVFSGGGGGKNIIIGFPDNDYFYDIYLLRPGEDEDDGVRIAKDVDLSGTSFYILEDNRVSKVIDGVGFVPGTSYLLLSYDDDGDTILEQMRIRDDEPSDLFDSRDWVNVGVYPDGEFMFIFEYRDDGARCYMAKFGDEADRVGKGTQCWPSWEGKGLIVIDVDDEETSFTKYDVKRGSDEEFLTADDVDSFRISEDLTKVAYVVNTSSDEQELHLFDMKSEEDEDLEEDFAIPEYGFTPNGDLYYIVEDDDGNLEAFVYGNKDAIAEGEVMSITPGPNGDYLIIVSGDDEDDVAVFSYSIRKEQAEEIVDGEYLRVAISEDPLQLFIAELSDGDLVFYTSDLDGRNLTEIYDEKDVFDYEVWYVLGSEYFYLMVDTEDGTTLFSCKAGDDECVALLEEYNQIMLLNQSSSGRDLVFVAAEDSGDDPILMTVKLGRDPDVIELDDDVEGVNNAVFTANDKDVLYTAVNGDDPDQISVNLVPVSGKDKPEELHDEAGLFDVEWGALNPFDYLQFSWLVYGGGN